MQILITRPEPDARELALVLLAAGHKPVTEPLMHVEFAEVPTLALAGVQAILLTSANGARALARSTSERDMALFCVGEASAGQARADGFTNITNSQGDSAALAKRVIANCAPSGGPLLHVAGSVVAGDLAGQLASAGFETRREVLYEAVVATDLSDDAKRVLAGGMIDAVMLFSPRTAKTFVSLLHNAHLEGAWPGLDLLCLSQAVADEMAGLACRSIRGAKKPTTDAMLALIE